MTRTFLLALALMTLAASDSFSQAPGLPQEAKIPIEEELAICNESVQNAEADLAVALRVVHRTTGAGKLFHEKARGLEAQVIDLQRRVDTLDAAFRESLQRIASLVQQLEAANEMIASLKDKDGEK